MRKKNYITFFKKISKIDKLRRFNFTAGHIGAFPNASILDKNIDELTNKNISIFVFLYIITKLLFLFLLSLIPVNNTIFFIRAILRKILNKNINYSNEFIVISVGDQSFKRDPYLSKILLTLNSKFDYFKIVGGKKIRTKEFIFFEQIFTVVDFLQIFYSIFLVQYATIYFLLLFIFSKNTLGTKLFFTRHCLEEMLSGALYNNYLLDIFGKKINVYGNYKKLIFPMEGRNWEKKIISNQNNSKCKCIGYIHCAITPFHLSLTSKMFYNLNEIPSVIITPSTMVYKLISKIFINSTIINGSFIRGSNLPNNLLVDKKLILIVLTSYIPEAKVIIESILSSGIHRRFRIQIKVHPDPITSKKIIKLVNQNKLSLFKGFSNLKPLVCLFRSSSIAIEYLRIGINPIYINLQSGFSNNIFVLDNLYNFTTLDIDKFSSFVPNKISYKKSKCVDISDYYLKISDNKNVIDYIDN